MTDLSKYANKVYKIIGAAMTVHSELGYGLLEPVSFDTQASWPVDQLWRGKLDRGTVGIRRGNE